MSLSRYLALCSFLLFAASLSAQEICDNGLDDDGDGLIDLNDTTDCNCPFISIVESLFPNPTFDEFSNDANCASNQTNGAPDGPGQANCIAGWQQASSATTDAWHLLTYNGNGPFWPDNIPQPIPSGLAVAGIFTGVGGFDGYREYLGACLPEPLEIGTPYRLNFQLGRANPTGNGVDTLVHSPENIDLAIYGIIDCDNIPFDDTQCPENAGAFGWELITIFSASGPVPGWENVVVDFTPTVSYAALAVGGTCAPDDFPVGFDIYREYYFVDDLIMNTVETFESTITVGSISVLGDDICADDATMLVEDFPGATYQWFRNGIVIPGATGLEYYPPLDEDFPGLYSCQITLPNGCGVAGPVELIRPVVTNAFQDSLYFCPFGFTTIIPNSQGGLIQSYLWSDGSSEPELDVFSAGTYNVTITSFCTQTIETIVVTEDELPTYELVIEPEIYCLGDEVKVYIETDWQLDAFVFSDFFNGIEVGDTATFIIQEEGQINFFVFSQGCLDDDNQSFFLDPESLDLDVNRNDLTCEAPITPLSLDELSGSIDDYTYEWRDPMGNLISTDAVTSSGTEGLHTVSVSPLNSDCVFTQDFEVVFNPSDLLVQSADVPTLTCLLSTGLLSIELTNPDEAMLQWSFDGQILSETSSILTVVEAGLYELFVFTLSIDGDTLCTQFYSYEVPFEQSAIPLEPVTSVDDICLGTAQASIQRTPEVENWQINWFVLNDPSPIASGVDSVDNLQAGNYEVRLTNPSGDCEAMATFTINSAALLSVQAGGFSLDCPTPDQPVQSGNIVATAFNGLPPFTYFLEGVIADSNSIGEFNDLPEGTYTVMVMDANGCTAIIDDAVELSFPELVVIEAGDDRLIKLGESVRLNVQSAGAPYDTIIWSPVEGLSCSDCPNPTATSLVNTLYTVTYISEDGCPVSDSLQVIVDPTGKVYIPTAFSPNFDGVNDRFQYFADQSFSRLIDFRIYDRWGGEVYIADPESTEPIGWDGNAADGRPYDVGVFVYSLKVELLNGERREFSGSVSLLR